MAGSKGTDVIEQLFADADALTEDKKELAARIDANRKALRTMRDAGVLTDEQYDRVDTIYPPRQRSEDADAPASE